MTDSGLPLGFAMRQLGYSDDEIDEATSEKQAQDQQNQQNFFNNFNKQ
jgi:hypothetical protein